MAARNRMERNITGKITFYGFNTYITVIIFIIHVSKERKKK